MTTKQQVREQITRVIQEGILENVLPYQSINGDFDCSIFNSDVTLCAQFDGICDFNNETDGCDTIGNPRCYELSAEQLTIANQNGSTCDDFSVTAQSYQSIVGDDIWLVLVLLGCIVSGALGSPPTATDQASRKGARAATAFSPKWRRHCIPTNLL